MNLKAIVEKCLAEVHLFKTEQKGQSPNCMQLFHIGVRDENPEAFAEIYKHFHSQIERWIYAHNGFYQTGESVDHFVSVTFTKFYHALQGEKFNRMRDFASVMTYLKLCVHSVIADYLRKLPPLSVNIDDVPIADPTPHSDLSFSLIWDRIIVLLPDAPDEMLARKVFVEGYKPGEIADAYPEDFVDARAVSVALQRIRRKLRSDHELRDLLGLDDSE